MSKSDKTVNPSTSKRSVSKNVALSERDIFFFKRVPVSDDYLRKLAFELVSWVLKDDKALKITQFRTSRHICRKTWDTWVKRSPELQDANDFALEVIGDRREIGGLEKRFDSSIVAYTMPHYDPVWKELVAWKASLQDKERNQQAQNFIIQMPSFGDMNAISNDDRKTEQVQAEALSDRSNEGSGER
jgi:hypothetical protein